MRAVFLLLTVVASGAALGLSAQAATRPFRVVLDPGHGGPDIGTYLFQGRLRITEKDVTLLLAREAAKLLRARGYEVLLTRNSDEDVALPSRTELANRVGADIFLSIHMNSTSGPQAREAEGVETFILNNTSDASSRRLAHLENSVLGGATRINDSAPASLDVALILKDLRLDGNLAESKRLACSLQEELVRATQTRGQPQSRNRGVKQALFHVLLGADMPSVLVEAGFLNSPRDRGLVLSPTGRARIGKAIVAAVDRFRRSQGIPSARLELSRCKVN